jgi:hypothetical protein
MPKMSKSTSFPYGANIMAKKKSVTKKRKGPAGVSKSEKIRQYKETHPEATTQEIAYALGYGGKVGYSLVYQVLNKGKKKKARKAARKTTTASSNGQGATELLRAALGLGLDSAIKLLEKVKKAVE